MEAMEDPAERPPTYPPGFEPPTDIDVPWYAWVLWPVAVMAAIGVGALFFRGCATWLA
jgi:hypothetical protein